jgi:hypothetical protein
LLCTLPQFRDQITDSRISIYFDHFPDKKYIYQTLKVDHSGIDLCSSLPKICYTIVTYTRMPIWTQIITMYLLNTSLHDHRWLIHFNLIYIYIYKSNSNTVWFNFQTYINVCSSLDGIWTHTIDTLQHHSLSLTSSALDHSTTFTPYIYISILINILCHLIHIYRWYILYKFKHGIVTVILHTIQLIS